jgi:hypothetical protein
VDDDALARAESVPQLLSIAAKTAADLVSGEACAISRIVGDVLVEVVEHSPSGQSLTLGQGFLVSDYPATREVIESRVPAVVCTADEDADPAEAALLRELGFEALLLALLEARGAPWALVEVYGGAGRRFEAADTERLQGLLASVAARLDELL